MANITQFKSVNILDRLFIQDNEVFPGVAQDTLLINSSSTALDQQPAGLDTPLRIEFGPAQSSPNNEIDMDNTGLFTINESGFYNFDLLLHFGRTGAAGISTLIGSMFSNGSPHPGTDIVRTTISSSDIVIPTVFTIKTFLSATTQVEFLIARDSVGNNSGGLFAFTPTTLLWPLSPTSIVTVSKVMQTII